VVSVSRFGMKLFGDVVKSRLNKDVPPVGYVARPGRP
jgi:hypothetical protein